MIESILAIGCLLMAAYATHGWKKSEDIRIIQMRRIWELEKEMDLMAKGGKA